MTPPVHGRWRLPAGSTYMKHNIPDMDNIVMNTTTSKAELYTLLMDAKVLWHGEGEETLLNSGPDPRPPTRLHSRTKQRAQQKEDRGRRLDGRHRPRYNL